MSTRKTPFLRLPYPWASDVVNVADMQSMAQSIDQALVQTAAMATNFQSVSSVIVQRQAVQSITKATVTKISFDTTVLDNGTDSPIANGPWFNASSPTRLTAPSACVVLANGLGSLTLGSALGAGGCVQTAITLNGVTSGNNMQGSKWGPATTDTGYAAASAISMWKLSAGDYLELSIFWSGTIVGPLNTATGRCPTLSLMMVALPSVS